MHLLKDKAKHKDLIDNRLFKDERFNYLKVVLLMDRGEFEEARNIIEDILLAADGENNKYKHKYYISLCQKAAREMKEVNNYHHAVETLDKISELELVS